MKTVEILGANRFENYTKTRDGSRAIIIEDGKILLTHELNSGWWLLPGGGIEDGETPEECMIREVEEETGMIVRPTEQFLTMHEYYEEYLYTGYFFVCLVTGKGRMRLTDVEKERGVQPEWLPLQDAYSYDLRNKEIWESNWKESDDFFYDNREIAEKYGLVTCIDGEPIGFVTWDPRNRPEYVEIGHNGIREKYKRQGYGHRQLEEAIRRIKEYEGLKRIIVCTNSNLPAPKNYGSAGFTLYDRKQNETESAYTGDFLYYEIIL